DRLWTVLDPSAGPAMATPLSSRGDASHPIVSRILKYGADCVLTIPFPAGLGLFWTGQRGADPFDGPQVAAFERLAAAIAARLQAAEARESRLDRLARIDAVDE